MKKILITTGGSGGHVIPSLIIYDALKNNFLVKIVTDLRGSNYINKTSYNFSIIDVPNIFSNLILIPINFIKFCVSIFKSYKYLKLNSIDILISTGGYMSLPLCIASKLLNIQIYIFEPNSVLGRTNKLTVAFSKKIICYNKNLKGISKKFIDKIYLINPLLRKEIYKYKKNENKEIGDQIKLLILGGSQGAKFFDDFISKIILKISKTQNIKVLQQVINKKSKEYLKDLYQKNNIEHELFEFDENLFIKAVNFNLAITRCGASAISELSYLNIPFIAIPFPYAKDNHQYYNAQFYTNNNSCWLIEQKDVNEDNFINLLKNIFKNKDEYLLKKKNLIKITENYTWENNKKKLVKVINEN